MMFLQEIVAQNRVWMWLLSAGTAAVVTGVLFLIRWGTRRWVVETLRARSELAGLASDLIRRTSPLFLLVVGLWAGSRTLALPQAAVQAIDTLVLIAFLFQVAGWGGHVLTLWASRAIRQKLEEEKDAATATTINAVAFLGKIALWVVILLLALAQLGVNVTALITGLGIAGIAVALAIQNILSDLLASISIVVDKPFLVGDFIAVGEHMGTVERIGLRTTRIRSLSGEQLIFSNSQLLATVIQNYKRLQERRAQLTFCLPFSTPDDRLARVPAIARAAVESQLHTRFGWALVSAYKEYGIMFEVVYHVLVPDYLTYRQVHSAVHMDLLRRLREEGMEPAYPTTVVGIRGDLPQPPGGSA